MTIDIWAGRTREQKEKLIEKVTQAVNEATGAPPEHIHVIVREVDKANWGVGGKPADKLKP